MGTPMIVLVASLAFLTALAVAWIAIRSRRSGNLKPPLETGRDRSARVQLLDIQPLSDKDRERFADRWRSTEAAFVANPAVAVSEAETLVQEVMQARGYPISDFSQRSADMSVAHPQFVANYREAREITLAYQRGAARAEDLKRATAHYRALFADLLGTTLRKGGA